MYSINRGLEILPFPLAPIVTIVSVKAVFVSGSIFFDTPSYINGTCYALHYSLNIEIHL